MGHRFVLWACVLLVAFAVGGGARILWEHAPRAVAQQDGSCDIVEMFDGEGDTSTPAFEVASNDWRIFYNFEGATGASDAGPFEISVYGADDNQLVQAITVEQPGSDTAFVNAGAGRYYLEVSSANVRWDITVEDCGETAPPEARRQPETVNRGVNGSERSTLPTPAPATSQRDTGGGELLRAGGSAKPPYPRTMDGNCPREFPVARVDGCYPSR